MIMFLAEDFFYLLQEIAITSQRKSKCKQLIELAMSIGMVFSWSHWMLYNICSLTKVLLPFWRVAATCYFHICFSICWLTKHKSIYSWFSSLWKHNAIGRSTMVKLPRYEFCWQTFSWKWIQYFQHLLEGILILDISSIKNSKL